MSAHHESKASQAGNRWTIPLLICVFISTAVLTIFLTRNASSRRSSEKIDSNQAEDQKTIYAAYGGSASCRECHEEAYKVWAGSHHGLAERLPNASQDDKAFVPNSTFDHATQKTSVRKVDGRYEIVTIGLNSTQQVFQVDRVIGEAPLRQMLIAFPCGRWQATEAAYDPQSNKWFNVYGLEDRHPGEWGHWTGRGMNWNSMCATCHNTGLRKNYDPTNDIYRTAMAERGVGCESCHGPMQAHNDWQLVNKGKGLSDPTVRRFSRDQMFDTCAACHSHRGEITGESKPGDNFFDHHLLSIVDSSDTFYPDGQMRDEDYEVSPFLGSRMYHKGVRCVDCHEPHSAKVRLPGNMMCLSCHNSTQTNAPAINPATHSHHKVFGFDTNGIMQSFGLSDYKPAQIRETGGECVNCHMPQTIYMQRHNRHDHGFTIPDPLLTKEFEIPNACNRCHQDKDTDWALKYVEQWYGEKMNRTTRVRTQTLARARNGDVAARNGVLGILQSNEQPYWRAAAARLLEHWIDQASVREALVHQLSDTNVLVRQSVAQTLDALGDTMPDNVRNALSERLNDSFRNVRVTAALSLMTSLNLDSEAAKDLQRMLQHNSDQPSGQMQLGNFALARGDVTNALLHFKTAKNWDAYSPEIRHEIAVLFSQLGQPQQAVKELQEAVQLAPKEAEFHFKLALAWNELGESKKCLKELETAVRLNPHHARAAYNLGVARQSAGDSTGALQALAIAEGDAPKNPRIPYARATIHASLGQINEARQAAQRALDIDPQYSEATVLLRQLPSM